MTRYRIWTGQNSDDFWAEKREDAIRQYVEMAGYSSIADAANECGVSLEDFPDSLDIDEFTA